MRAAKWTLIVVGSLLLALAAAVFVVTSVVDPNRYKGKVEAIVGDRVGRALKIEGDLEITWFPWLGVRMGAAHLANPPGDAQPPLIEWQSLEVAARVLPLLRGELVVDRIRLQRPQIRLRRDAQGHGNWEELTLGASAPVGPSAPAGTSAASRPPSARSASLQIAGLEIRDGDLTYVDEEGGLEINLSKLDFEMGAWQAGQSLPVHTRFLVNGAALPPPGVPVELNTPALDVKLESPITVAAPKLEIRVADAEIKGDLSYRQTASGEVSAHGALAAQVPSLRKLITQLGLNQTMPHDPGTLGKLELTTTWSYEQGLLSAKPIALTLDGVKLQGWVERHAPPASEWRFELHGDRIDLGRYVNVDSTRKKAFELDMLKTINANGSLIFDEAQLADTHLSDVRLRVETPEAKQ